MRRSGTGISSAAQFIGSLAIVHQEVFNQRRSVPYQVKDSLELGSATSKAGIRSITLRTNEAKQWKILDSLVAATTFRAFSGIMYCEFNASWAQFRI